MTRLDDYEEIFYVVEPSEKTALAIDRRKFWHHGYEPERDDDGYYQPDEYLDCDPQAIAIARLIAAAPLLFDALSEIVSAADGGGWGAIDPTLKKAREALEQALK